MTPSARNQAVIASCAAAGIASVLAACGHGASSVAQNPAQSHGGLQSVQFKITVPTAAPSPSASPKSLHSHSPQRHGAKQYYVSGGTTAAGVTVTPQGGAPYPTIYFSCTSSSCTGSVNAPV